MGQRRASVASTHSIVTCGFSVTDIANYFAGNPRRFCTIPPSSRPKNAFVEIEARPGPSRGGDPPDCQATSSAGAGTGSEPLAGAVLAVPGLWPTSGGRTVV